MAFEYREETIRDVKNDSSGDEVVYRANGMLFWRSDVSLLDNFMNGICWCMELKANDPSKICANQNPQPTNNSSHNVRRTTDNTSGLVRCQGTCCGNGAGTTNARQDLFFWGLVENS